MYVPVSLPHNLARIRPAWLNFRIVSPERIRMRKGAEVDYQIRWLGLPLKWKRVITAYQHNAVFRSSRPLCWRAAKRRHEYRRGRLRVRATTLRSNLRLPAKGAGRDPDRPYCGDVICTSAERFCQS